MSSEQEKKFQELNKRKQDVVGKAYEINATIDSAQKRLNKLKEDAQRRFGESDLEKLRQMALQWSNENEEKLKIYEKEIADLENEVTVKAEMIRQVQG